MLNSDLRPKRQPFLILAPVVQKVACVAGAWKVVGERENERGRGRHPRRPFFLVPTTTANLYSAVLDSATGLLSTYPPDSDLNCVVQLLSYRGPGGKIHFTMATLPSCYLVFCSYFHARKEKRNC